MAILRKMIQGHFGLLHRESKPTENIGSEAWHGVT